VAGSRKQEVQRGSQLPLARGGLASVYSLKVLIIERDGDKVILETLNE